MLWFINLSRCDPFSNIYNGIFTDVVKACDTCSSIRTPKCGIFGNFLLHFILKFIIFGFFILYYLLTNKIASILKAFLSLFVLVQNFPLHYCSVLISAYPVPCSLFFLSLTIYITLYIYLLFCLPRPSNQFISSFLASTHTQSYMGKGRL